jgi:hypothetical protein
MYCGKCGAENPDDARFCGHCGAAINAGMPPPSADTRPAEVMRLLDLDTPPETVSPGLKWGILGASLLIPLIGIGMGLYYWIKGGSEEKTAVGRLWFFVALGLAVLYGMLAGEGY